jgi:hypothetical protein
MKPRLVSLLLLAAMHSTGAQVTAATLLGKMENFGVYPIAPVQLDKESYAGFGIGYEISFSVGEMFSRPLSADERQKVCAKAPLSRRRTPEQCRDPNYKVDTTYAITSVRRGPDGAILDSTFAVTINPAAFAKPRLGLEVAVANHVTRMRQVGIIPGWNLSGKIEEFPVLTIYGTIDPEEEGWSTYIGPRLIIGKLDGARIAQGDSAATLTGTATGGGIAFGQVLGLGNFNFFAELDWSMLRFATGEWKVPGNMTPAERAALPKHIALTGFRFMTGLQISLTK